MLKFYSFEENSTVQASFSHLDTENVHAGTTSWIHCIHPDKDELVMLSEKYKIPQVYLEAALDDHERPRLEHTEDSLLILVRVPLHDPKNKDVLLSTYPLGIILTSEIAITVCLQDNIVEKLMEPGLKGKDCRVPIQFALTLMLRISSHFITALRHMSELVNIIERTLHRSMRNSELVNMLRIEKSLIYSYTAIKGNNAVLEKIRGLNTLPLSTQEGELLEDAFVENKQAADMAEIFSQIMGSVSDAFGAIVSNNLNKVMRLLTSLTLLFMIPSTVAAVYGMNVVLPLQENPNAFAFILLFSLGLPLILSWIFWKKDWF